MNIKERKTAREIKQGLILVMNTFPKGMYEYIIPNIFQKKAYK